MMVVRLLLFCVVDGDDHAGDDEDNHGIDSSNSPLLSIIRTHPIYTFPMMIMLYVST